MIIQKRLTKTDELQLYGRPWKLKIGKHYVGSFALIQQAQAAEQVSHEYFEEHGHYPKISSKEYIPKRWAYHINNMTLQPDEVLTTRDMQTQVKINRAERKAERKAARQFNHENE